MPDLFGTDIPVNDNPYSKETILGRWTRFQNYRKAEHGSQERCGTCVNSVVRKVGYKYLKCKYIGMSHSASTDVRAYHVCNLYKSE